MIIVRKNAVALSLSELPSYLASVAKGGRVYVPGGPVEPVALAQCFFGQPNHAAQLTFTSLMIPSVNTIDWAAFHHEARGEVFLPSAAVFATVSSGQTQILPLHYSAAYRYLCLAPFKAALFHVCPPDVLGRCNTSLSNDANPAFLDRDVTKIGIINHSLPTIAGAPAIPCDMFDAVVEIDAKSVQVAPQSNSSQSDAIARHVASLVENGATLQAGIGRLPGAIMSALTNHKRLRVHSGLIGDWTLDLLNSGALSDTAQALTAGVILGSQSLHEALADDGRVSLQPIGFTHSHHVLAKLERFTSINAALEIDLFGQINCEYAGGRSIGGIGGALDFLRGARASVGGKPIVMIASTGKDGISRILPRLTCKTVSITRADPPILVTEHGAIDLEPLDIQARSRAIISLAAPQHQDALAKAWRDMPT